MEMLRTLGKGRLQLERMISVAIIETMKFELTSDGI